MGIVFLVLLWNVTSFPSFSVAVDYTVKKYIAITAGEWFIIHR